MVPRQRLPTPDGPQRAVPPLRPPAAGLQGADPQTQGVWGAPSTAVSSRRELQSQAACTSPRDPQHWGWGGAETSPGRSLSCPKCLLLPLQSHFPDSRGTLVSQEGGGRRGQGHRESDRPGVTARTVGFLGAWGAGFSLPQTQGNPQLPVHPKVTWGRAQHFLRAAWFGRCNDLPLVLVVRCSLISTYLLTLK